MVHRSRGLLALSVGLVAQAHLSGAAAPQSAPGQAAIDALLAGRQKVARASWWGFDRDDSTRALQAAVDSGAKRVIVEDMGAPWIVDQIRLAADQEVVFEKGVVVEAKRGAFRGTNDALFSAVLKENVALTGYGATLRMHKADYAGPDYVKGEWRHVLSLLSCHNVRVAGLTLAESGGDGVYLGVGKPGVPNTNVRIRDVVCDRNYRQGISVISARNLLIENCVLKDTSGTAPSAGIDFEPNEPTEELVHCVMRNCTVQGNRGDGYALYLNALRGNSTPVSISIEHCRSIGNGGSAVSCSTGNRLPEGAVKGRIEFTDCRFEGNSDAAIRVSDKPARGCRLRFVRCAIADPAINAPKRSPIVFGASAGDAEDIGGVAFLDCLVSDPVDRPPMAFLNWSGGVGVAGVTGALILERGGERKSVALTPKVLTTWMPVARERKIARFDDTGIRYQPLVPSATSVEFGPANVHLRERATFALYATASEQVTLTVRYAQVAKYYGSAMPIDIVAPSGAALPAATAAFQADTEVRFAAAETGVFSLTCAPGLNAVQIVHSSHPVCLSCKAAPPNLYSTTGEFWFWVPAKTREFGVKVYGQVAGEGVKAGLINAAGQVVEERDNITTPHLFVVERQPSRSGEAWRIRTDRPSGMILEDYYVDLFGVPPLLAATREALLVPVE